MALTGHLVEVHVTLSCQHPESMHSSCETERAFQWSSGVP